MFVSILKNTWQRTNSKEFFKWFFGSIGGVLALLLAGKNFLGLDAVKSSIFGGYGFGGIYIVRFGYNGMKVTLEHFLAKYRDSIYGNAIILLKDAFAKVHLIRKSKTTDPAIIVNTLVFMCNQLKIYFDKKTKQPCGVSIKIAIKSKTSLSSDTKLHNLCRDKSNTKRDTETYKNIEHKIFNNSCFNHIFSHLTGNQKNKLFYINNDIEGSKDYQNTSKQAHEDGKLPYKSEIVVPIIPLSNETDREYNLFGFICVDSPQKNSFDDNYDLAILQGVADGIYDIIQQWSQRKIQQQ